MPLQLVVASAASNNVDIESTFIVEPYFFSQKAHETGLLKYKWMVNGKLLEDSEKRQEITFSGDLPGSSFVSVEISNPYNILQAARSLFNVVVNKNNE